MKPIVLESSWGTYYPGEYPSPPPEYETCLGDLYSVAWMEDSDIHNLRKETLHQQYEIVKRRTINDNYAYGSHVMQLGDIGISMDNLFTCLGTNPANDNFKFVDGNSLLPPTKAINQRYADLFHFWDKYRKAPDVLVRKVEAQKQYRYTVFVWYEGSFMAVLRHTTQPVSKGMRHSLNPRQNGTVTYTDKEGIRQQQLLAFIPRHHKHYILPNSVSKKVHFSPQLQTDPRENYLHAKSCLQPSAIGPFIVAPGGISNIFLNRLAENIQDAYGEAASIAE
ncbi:hypothetical protein GOBAR_DD28277 [Gossypium barbadense]|nr:hypothetical protein GOBAR_DD28277 [Gossypium barbadense]